MSSVWNENGGNGDGEIDENELKVERQPLYQNQFVRISKGRYQDHIVAVKEICTAIPILNQRKMKQEAESLRELKHANVVKFHGILCKCCAIVTEYLEKRTIVENKEMLVKMFVAYWIM